MNASSSLLLAASLLFALSACDQRSEPTDSKGGNGSDTFVPDVEAARAKDVSQMKNHPKSPNQQRQQSKSGIAN